MVHIINNIKENNNPDALNANGNDNIPAPTTATIKLNTAPFIEFLPKYLSKNDSFNLVSIKS